MSRRPPHRPLPPISLAAVAVGALLSAPAHAAETLTAVAANFAPTAQRLQDDFEGRTGHTVVLVSGATGALYAQITHGAPFAVFLAADQARPERLEAAGKTAPDGRFTYAIGRLALWGPTADFSAIPGPDYLAGGSYRWLARANPAAAPYGAAAEAVLARLALEDAVQGRIVTAENVAQAYAMAASGAADIAFVAAATLSRAQRSAAWIAPAELHAPIRQDAVLLARGADDAAARAFFAYLRSAPARALIADAGYGAP